MKHKLLIIMVAAFTIGCGLFFSSCTSKSRQLDAALEAINKQYPMQVAEGTTLEGFFANDQNVDIAVTLADAAILTPITDQRLQEMKDGFNFYFACVAREDNQMRDFFQLLVDNGKTLSITITTTPSHHRHTVAISQTDLQQILSVNQ